MSTAGDVAALAALLVRESFAAFGGGLSVLPAIERVVVEQRRWLTAQQFVDVYALGQLTPGPGMLMVMGIGYRIGGVPGALIAALAMFVPTAALSYIAGARWSAAQASRWRMIAAWALAPVTVGLIVAGTWTLTTTAIPDARSAAIAVLAALLLLSGRVSPALIVLAGGLAGFALYH
jgi:chromate transporter